MNRKRVITGLWALGLTTLALMAQVACAETEGLQARALSYWNAQVEGDWAHVYDLTSPEDGIKSATRDDFVKFRNERGPFIYVSATLGAEYTSGTMGWVQVNFSAKPKLMPQLPPQAVTTWDLWYQKDQQWYPMPREMREVWPSAPPSARPTAEEAGLEKRVRDFWDARKQGDRERVYRYLQPEFRANIDKRKFMEGTEEMTFLNYSIDWVEVKDHAGKVRIQFAVKPKDPHLSKSAPSQKTVIEKWVKVNNFWYIDTAG